PASHHHMHCPILVFFPPPIMPRFELNIELLNARRKQKAGGSTATRLVLHLRELTAGDAVCPCRAGHTPAALCIPTPSPMPRATPTPRPTGTLSAIAPNATPSATPMATPTILRPDGCWLS